MPVVVLPEAVLELQDAFEWYEGRQPGLGNGFTDQVQLAIDRIVDMPGAHEVVVDDVHRCVVRQFPYAIYFRIELTRVEIVAIFHGKRDPRDWRERR